QNTGQANVSRRQSICSTTVPFPARRRKSVWSASGILVRSSRSVAIRERTYPFIWSTSASSWWLAALRQKSQQSRISRNERRNHQTTSFRIASASQRARPLADRARAEEARALPICLAKGDSGCWRLSGREPVLLRQNQCGGRPR